MYFRARVGLWVMAPTKYLRQQLTTDMIFGRCVWTNDDKCFHVVDTLDMSFLICRFMNMRSFEAVSTCLNTTDCDSPCQRSSRITSCARRTVPRQGHGSCLQLHSSYSTPWTRFDIENPHSGLGLVREFDREEWLLKYKDDLPLMILDVLRVAFTFFWLVTDIRGGSTQDPRCP